jgi:hypothetical protein
VILYVYTIQHSNEPNETYNTYFTAAERCQHQIFDTSEPGSLTARYCLVLEELRGEALRQIETLHLPEDQVTPNYRSLNTTRADVDGTGSSAVDIAYGFPTSIADLETLGNLGDFHFSPSDSLEDLTSWGQFDSMVSVVILRYILHHLGLTDGDSRQFPASMDHTTCNQQYHYFLLL